MTTRLIHSVTFKVLGIAVLALLMLIPLGQVNDLVREREGRAGEATAQIASRWGGQQLVGGPVLVVPVRYQQQQGKELVSMETTVYLLPDRLAVHATLAPELRRYGLYETPVYLAELGIEGRFSSADIAALAAPGQEPQWQRAELRVPVADVRGIRRVSALRVGERELNFGPGGGGIAGIAAVAAPLPLDPAALPPQLPFAFELTLAGSERFAALPLARQTELRVGGAWPDPGFDGAFLPATRRVDAGGFEASWQVLDLNRRIAQRWSESEASSLSIADSSFGVSLMRPAGAYQQNVRAGKYGVLFIGLVLMAAFMFELFRKLRLHPIQYGLVGLSIALFFLLLLALSEKFAFWMAYAGAAAASVALLAVYFSAVLGGWRRGLSFGAFVALLYGALYGLLASESNALLLGALLIFGMLATLMLVTRKVDWYALSRRVEPAPEAQAA